MILCLGTTPTVQRTMVFGALAYNEINRAEQTIDQASGKNVNVARVLKALGEEPLATGFVGGDTGRLLLDDLTIQSVAHDFVQTRLPTRMCVTVVDRGAGTATELIQEAHPVEDEAWDSLMDKVRLHLPQARMLVLSGSLPPRGQNDLYARCCEEANRLKVPVVLDTRAAPLLAALPLKPFIVKSNRSELQQTLDMVLDNESAIRAAITEVVRMGAQWVLVTMGANGAIIGDGRRAWRLTVPRVEALNAIGSGDAFTAGVVTGVLRGDSVDQACRLGGAAGAANALSLTAGTVDPADVARLLPQIVLQPL